MHSATSRIIWRCYQEAFKACNGLDQTLHGEQSNTRACLARHRRPDMLQRSLELNCMLAGLQPNNLCRGVGKWHAADAVQHKQANKLLRRQAHTMHLSIWPAML